MNNEERINVKSKKVRVVNLNDNSITFYPSAFSACAATHIPYANILYGCKNGKSYNGLKFEYVQDQQVTQPTISLSKEQAEQLLSSKDAEIQDWKWKLNDAVNINRKFEDEIQQLKDDLKLKTMQADDFCRWLQDREKEIQQLKEEKDGLKEQFNNAVEAYANLDKSKGATREQIEKAWDAARMFTLYNNPQAVGVWIAPIPPNKSKYIESQFKAEGEQDKK